VKKIWSYIWPVTKYVSSDFNGKLELSLVNGKKILDSKNTNYSYGSLQRILKFGLSKVTVPVAKNILVLGLGGGSIIETLQKDYNYHRGITAVELDAKVIEIADKEFGISQEENLQIIHDDAFLFVSKGTQKFDIIIVDLFIDLAVPKSCYSISFWQSLQKRMSNSGSVIFNAGVNLQKKEALHKIMNQCNDIFEFQLFENVDKTNTLLIAELKSS